MQQVNSLENFKNSFTKNLYGMTKAEAHASGICLQCQEPAIPKCYSNAGREEYRISGLCELCWNEMFGEDDEY